MRTKRSNSFRLKAESQYAPIVSRAVGVVDFFFAATAAYFVLELVFLLGVQMVLAGSV